jgi:alpha-tubulin suppressor-like RCC1 family protein
VPVHAQVAVWGEGSWNVPPALVSGLSDVEDMILTPANGFVILFANGTMADYTVATGNVPPQTPTVILGVAAIEGTRRRERPHFLALMKDGSVRGWGNDYFGQATGPGRLADGSPAGVVAKRLAAGRHTLMLYTTANKSVQLVGFGPSFYGQGRTPPGLADVAADIVELAAGEDFSMALLRNGSLIVWGRLDSRPALPPAALASGAPGGAPAVAGVRKVVSGYDHGLILYNSGRVAAFGQDDCGETVLPSEVGAANNIVDVAAGNCHSLALLASGRVMSWGSQQDSDVPPQLKAVPGGAAAVTAMAAGFGFSAVALADSSVTVWGARQNDSSGCSVQANLGGPGIPVFPSDARPVALAAGRNHILALLSNGSASAWGCNDQNQTALPPDAYGGNVVAVAAGMWHSVLLLRNGRVLGAGANNLTQLADTLGTLEGVVGIGAGAYATVAQVSDGKVIYLARELQAYKSWSVPADLVATSIAASNSYVVAALAPQEAASTSSSTSGHRGSATLSSGAIAGIAIGSTALALSLAAAVVLLVLRRRRSKHDQERDGVVAEAGKFGRHYPASSCGGSSKGTFGKKSAGGGHKPMVIPGMLTGVRWTGNLWGGEVQGPAGVVSRGLAGKLS